jgi:2-iminobutanoate/2-iminopropanoate deaminase
VAFDSDGGVVGEDDFYAQSMQTFKNIEEALSSVGAKMVDVVKITTYLTDMSGYPEFSRARAEIFPDGVPSSATVVSPALILPELLVEIEAMAIIGSGD